jgi:hypothetical protein
MIEYGPIRQYIIIFILIPMHTLAVPCYLMARMVLSLSIVTC